MDDVAERTRLDEQQSTYRIGHSGHQRRRRYQEGTCEAAGLPAAWASIHSTACGKPSATMVRRQPRCVRSANVSGPRRAGEDQQALRADLFGQFDVPRAISDDIGATEIHPQFRDRAVIMPGAGLRQLQ